MKREVEGEERKDEKLFCGNGEESGQPEGA